MIINLDNYNIETKHICFITNVYEDMDGILLFEIRFIGDNYITISEHDLENNSVMSSDEKKSKLNQLIELITVYWKYPQQDIPLIK